MDLKAAGFILNLKYITDSAATTNVTLGSTITHTIGLTNSGKRGVVYLPADGIEGRVIWAKQIGQGSTRFYPQGGQKIFDDISENEYYDCTEGEELKFVFVKMVIGGNNVEVWVVSRYKY
jgi:hypothetical protein